MSTAPRPRLPALALLNLAFALLAGPGFAAERRPASDPAAAESLYAAGEFTAAERAFQDLPMRSVADTLIGLRRAALHLWRDDPAGSRRELDAVDRIRPGLRSSRALRAESWMREDSCVKAAPLYRANGHEAKAAQCESFAGSPPYQIEGGETSVRFAQTDPLPVISIEVGDRGPRWFLIDTGGGDMVLDPALADSLGLPKFGEETGTFAGGKQRAVALSRLDRIRLGGVVVRNLPVGLLDVSRLGAVAGGRSLSGIVGTRLLSRFRSTFDYPGGRLLLAPRHGGAAAHADTSRIETADLPMWLGGDHLILARGRLGEGHEALWFVDTGLAGSAVTAPASSLTDAGIALPDTSHAMTGQGGGGAVRAQMFAVPSFHMGVAEGKGLLGVFGAFPPSLERGQGYRIAGIISHAFFRPWRVTFDFDAMRLHLERDR